jgi:endonuclease/exonuclease/phosphatase (EEP) superfamily protein YafD
LRLTAPRRLILDVVRRSDAHPTATFVYARVRRRLPRASLATVYRHSDEERGKISAVHFVRFPLPPEAQRDFEAAEVALVVEHPNEHARAVLAPATKRSLAQDLA